MGNTNNTSSQSQKIYIENSEGAKFPIDVDLSITIKKIKDIIYNQTGILQNRQILYYDKLKLEDDHNLLDYNIKVNSVIKLIVLFDKSKSFIDNLNLKKNEKIVYLNGNKSLLLNKSINPSLSVKSKDEKNISIIIKPLNMSQITINVNPSIKIENIKAIIKEKLLIPIENQNLMFGGNSLEDGKLLNDYHILDNSSINLLFKKFNSKDEKKILFIRTLEGNLFSISLDNLKTIKDIKNKIYKIKGIPTEKQKLFLGGKVLENNKTLKECNINHLSTIYLGNYNKDSKVNESNNNKNINSLSQIQKKKNLHSNIG